MLTTLAQAHVAPFVALLFTAALMAAASAGLQDDPDLRWWHAQASATRQFFLIAGLLGVACLTQGVDESVAWMLAIGVAFGVDFCHELHLQRTSRR